MFHIFHKFSSIYTSFHFKKLNPSVTIALMFAPLAQNRKQLWYSIKLHKQRKQKDILSWSEAQFSDERFGENLLCMKPFPRIFWFREHPTRITDDREWDATTYTKNLQSARWSASENKLRKEVEGGNSTKAWDEAVLRQWSYAEKSATECETF